MGFCAICQVEASVRRVTVRGLCELSMFDRWLLNLVNGQVWELLKSFRVYNYIINEEGQPMYLGSRTSVLFYNKTIPSWVWWVSLASLKHFCTDRFVVDLSNQRYDRKDPSSVAVSISPEASLMLGTTLILAFTISILILVWILVTPPLLLGVHNVDFSGVRDDKCHTG